MNNRECQVYYTLLIHCDRTLHSQNQVKKKNKNETFLFSEGTCFSQVCQHPPNPAHLSKSAENQCYLRTPIWQFSWFLFKYKKTPPDLSWLAEPSADCSSPTLPSSSPRPLQGAASSVPAWPFGASVGQVKKKAFLQCCSHSLPFQMPLIVSKNIRGRGSLPPLPWKRSLCCPLLQHSTLILQNKTHFWTWGERAF